MLNKDREQTIFIQWAPDSARMKEKMIYAANAAQFKELVDRTGIYGSEVSLYDEIDLDEEYLVSMLN